jgi:hypothetical protein
LIKNSLSLEKTQKDAIISFIYSLSNIYHHHKEFVKRVFAYISLTDGLSENELLELLSRIHYSLRISDRLPSFIHKIQI